MILHAGRFYAKAVEKLEINSQFLDEELDMSGPKN